MLYQLSCYSVLLPLLTGFLFWRHLSVDSKVITFICLFATFPQLMASWYDKSPYRWVAYNLYTFCDSVLILLYFHFVLKQGIGRSVYLFVLSACSLTALFFITRSSIFNFQNYWVCINAFMYIILTLCVFGQQIIVYQEKLLDFSVAQTWYLAAFLLYNVSTFLVMLLFKVLHQDRENPLWSIHHIFNTFFYVLLAIGLLQNRQVVFEKYKAQ